MRVVFDTNIFVSALAIPGGRAQKALMRVVEGKDRLILSKAIIKELLDVLSRKFARDQEALAHTAVFLSEISELVHPRRKLSVLKDGPIDNPFLLMDQDNLAILTGIPRSEFFAIEKRHRRWYDLFIL